MKCSATIRYARRCSRTASWMVDGEPMCGQHATKASVKLDDDQCYPLTQWSGTCTGAFYCPAAVHFQGCFAQVVDSAVALAAQVKAHGERFGT